MSLGVNALHFTARKKVVENSKLDMGQKYEVDEAKIKSIVTEINAFNKKNQKV